MSHLQTTSYSASTSYSRGKRDANQREQTYELQNITSDAEVDVPPQARAKWHLPSFVVLTYLFAVFCAIAHLILFRHLDSRRLEIDTSIPQSWIAPISLVLGLAFRAALCASLSTSFAQHMWRIMMGPALPIKSIDRIYSMQRNPFALFHFDNRVSPILLLLACLSWSIPIVVIFPSGAIIIEGRLHPLISEHRVPTFDPAYVGNGSLNDGMVHSLAPDDLLYTYSMLQGAVDLPNLLSSSAAISLTSERIYTIPSSCGPNCTYTVEFEGPFLKCNETTWNTTQNDRTSSYEVFKGDWDSASDGWKRLKPADNEDEGVIRLAPDTFTLVSRPSYAWDIYTDLDRGIPTNSILLSKSLTCSPCRANYTLHTNYTSGEGRYNLESHPWDCLSDFWYSGSLNEELYDENFSFNNSEHALGNLRATNLFLLVHSLVKSLAGKLTCRGIFSNMTYIDIGSVTLPKNLTANATEAEIVYCQYPKADNGTNIAHTPFNSRRFAKGFESADIDITQDLLNEVLANITISTMNRLHLWSTNSQTTRQEWANIYRFAQPMRLILFYFIPLALAVPFLILGFIDLAKSGVAAPTEGLQNMLILGAQSNTIWEAARENKFEERANEANEKRLGDLRVRYGEFDESRGYGKGFGLGVEDELVGLCKKMDRSRA